MLLVAIAIVACRFDRQLVAKHTNVARRVDTDANRRAADAEDSHGDIVANFDLLLKLAGQDEHGTLLCTQ